MATTLPTERNPEEVFVEELKEASDVCLNCFSPIRRPREEPSKDYMLGREFWYGGTRPWRGKVTTPEGDEPTPKTTIGYPPENAPSRPGTLFCECGASGPRHRIRYGYVGPGLFGMLLNNALDTLEEKDVDFDRLKTAQSSWYAATEGFVWPDHTAEDALQHGIAKGVLSVREGDDDFEDC